MGEALRSAVSRCPFLHKVSTSQGEGVAMEIALRPFVRAGTGGVLADDVASLEATARIFHGPTGVCPLRRFAEEGGTAPPPRVCPYSGQQLPQQPRSESPAPSLVITAPEAPAEPKQHAAVAAPPFRGAPMASIGLSAFNFLPDPGEFFRRHGGGGGRPRKPNQHKPQRGSSSSQAGGSQAGSGTATKPSSPSSAASKGGPAPGSGGASSGALKSAASGGGGGGQCPMRKFFGPLGGLLPLSASGHLQCPSAIIKMRAAVAALKPVRELRPQALPVRALAMGATAVAANVPCGMWREHTRKFSPEWFLAVHATIPFVAMLRKAVLMPKWAILLTLLGAVAGQQAGAKLERKRLATMRDIRSARSVQGAGACRQADKAPSLRLDWAPHVPAVPAA